MLGGSCELVTAPKVLHLFSLALFFKPWLKEIAFILQHLSQNICAVF